MLKEYYANYLLKKRKLFCAFQVAPNAPLVQFWLGMPISFLNNPKSSKFPLHRAYCLALLSKEDKALDILDSIDLKKHLKTRSKIRHLLVQRLTPKHPTRIEPHLQYLCQNDLDLQATAEFSIRGKSNTPYTDPLIKLKYQDQNLSVSEKQALWLEFFTTYNLTPPTDNSPLQDYNFKNVKPPNSPYNTRVTVAVTTYNSAKTLARCLTSLLNQTHRNLEILLIDDASTDDTVSIARSMLHNSKHKILVNQTNLGTYQSRNKALEKATGKYFTNLDSDDWAHPERITKHLDEHTHNINSFVATTSHLIKLDEKGKIFTPYLYPFVRQNTSSLFIATDVLRELGGYKNERIAADSELELRLISKFDSTALKRINLPLVIGLHCTNSLTNSLSTATNSAQGAETRYRLREKWINELDTQLRNS